MCGRSAGLRAAKTSMDWLSALGLTPASLPNAAERYDDAGCRPTTLAQARVRECPLAALRPGGVHDSEAGVTICGHDAYDLGRPVRG